MKISGMQAIPFTMRLVEPIVWATGRLDHAEHVLIRIQTDEGIEGIGEAVPRPTIYGETQESIVTVVEKKLAPMLIGLDPFDLEKVWGKMETIIWNPTAKGAIDVALHDIIGKKLGIPCSKLLGGWTDRVPLTWMVGIKKIEEMVEEVRQKIAEGYNSFKLKGGLDAKKDVAMVREIRQELGSNVRLYLDANQGYSTQEAIEVMNALENELACVEEPLPVWDSAGRKKVSQYTRIPILADESVFTISDVVQQIDLGAIGQISIKIPRTGFSISRRIVALAEAHNIPLQIGTQAETPLGTIATVHFAAAFRRFTLPNEITYFLNVEGSLLQQDPVITDGYMLVPQGPGLGVQLDEEKVKFFRNK